MTSLSLFDCISLIPISSPIVDNILLSNLYLWLKKPPEVSFFDISTFPSSFIPSIKPKTSYGSLSTNPDTIKVRPLSMFVILLPVIGNSLTSNPHSPSRFATIRGSIKDGFFLNFEKSILIFLEPLFLVSLS